MRTVRFVLGGVVLLLAVALHAGSRESAFQARVLLGPDIWSRVLKIENHPAGRPSRYPADLHALVFAFEGILWFYTEFDGTQSLSLSSGRLAADQADPGPLLRAIEPGLTQFTDVTEHAPAGPPGGRPPNDCFIACVAHWQGLLHGPVPPSRVRLLTYYRKSLQQGHTLLEYWQDGRRLVFDPEEPDNLREVPLRVPDNPMDVAHVIYRHQADNRPSKAVYFELSANLAEAGTTPLRLQTAHGFWNSGG